MNDFFEFLVETLKMAVLAFLIVLPIRFFLFQPFIVSGSSMFPNFESGDYLLIDEISYRFRKPERGEVIVFRAPPDPSARYIKRIIGLPGETIVIKDGKVSISNITEHFILDEPYLGNLEIGDEIEMSLNNEEYFVMGDNRLFSSDSRTWGPLSKRNIIGRAIFRAFPLSRIGTIGAPDYVINKPMVLLKTEIFR